MSYIDIIILVPLIIAGIRGFKKGFISELSSLIALFVGVLGAVHLSYFLADTAVSQGWVDAENRFLGPVSFVITFMAIVFCLNMIGNLVTSLLNVVALGLVNRIVGAIFGAAKMLFILSILLIAIDSFGKEKPIIPEEMIKDSALLEPMREVATSIMPSLKRMIPWDSVPTDMDEFKNMLK